MNDTLINDRQNKIKNAEIDPHIDEILDLTGDTFALADVFRWLERHPLHQTWRVRLLIKPRTQVHTWAGDNWRRFSLSPSFPLSKNQF